MSFFKFFFFLEGLCSQSWQPRCSDICLSLQRARVSSETATIPLLSASVKYFPAHCMWGRQVCKFHKKELHKWLLNNSYSHSGLDLTPCNRPQRGHKLVLLSQEGPGSSPASAKVWIMLFHWLKNLCISAWGYPETQLLKSSPLVWVLPAPGQRWLCLMLGRRALGQTQGLWNCSGEPWNPTALTPAGWARQSYPEGVVMVLSCFRVLEAFSQVWQLGEQIFIHRPISLN